MNKLILISLIIFCSIFASSQSDYTQDSLYLDWENEQLSDSIRDEAMLSLIRRDLQTRPKDEMLQIIDAAINQAERGGNQHSLALFLIQRGNIYFLANELPLAKQIFERSLEISESIGFYKGQASAWQSLGNVYDKQGKLDEGLKTKMKCLEIRRNIKGSTNLGAILYNIGLYYMRNGEYDEALDYYDQAIQNYEKFGEKYRLSHAYIGTGHIYSAMAEYTTAMNYYYKSLEIGEEIANLIQQGHAYNSLGNLFYILGDFVGAQKNFQQAVNIYSSLGYSNYVDMVNQNLANIERLAGNYLNILEIYFKGLNNAKIEEDYLMQIRLNQHIADCYMQINEHNKALECYNSGLKLFELVGDKLLEARLLGSKGIVLIKLDRLDEARIHLEKSLTSIEEIGIPSQEAFAQHNLAELEILEGNLTQAETLNSKIREQYRIQKDSFRLISVLHMHAQILLLQNRLDEALVSANEARKIAKKRVAHKKN